MVGRESRSMLLSNKSNKELIDIGGKVATQHLHHNQAPINQVVVKCFQPVATQGYRVDCLRDEQEAFRSPQIS